MKENQMKSKSFMSIFTIILDNWKRASVMQGAAAMTYYLLLSLLPILLVFANVIPLLPFSSGEAISFIESAFPADITQILIPIVKNYLESGSGGAISLGLLASIWSASKVFSTLRKVLDDVYGATEKKNFIISRLLSLLVMLVILVVVGASVFIFVFGRQILSFIESFFEIQVAFFETFLVLRWMLFPLVLILVGLIIYDLVPNHHLKINYALPGTIFVTVSLILLSQSFSLLTNYIGGDAIANQTIGGFIALMLFLFIGNVLILFGALINTMFYEIKNGESVTKYEMRLSKKEDMKSANWTGNPDEKEDILLNRKLFKI
ncbi:MAG: YihY/virulence factor BrkB family protein [Atopostipes suicloacalis]|nr:YihY/virulence factor BrkB family protein [Atopostipes suicloacalis]